MIYDSEKLPQIPKITMRVKGKKLYDPRLNSTVGGSGSQRLGTPSTHTEHKETKPVSHMCSLFR